MPHKHNAARRHHIGKMKFKVTNWAEYETGLRRRGSLTLWITPEALSGWAAKRRKTRGGQPRYSDMAIETTLTLGMVFGLRLRQSEGLLSSVLDMMALDLPVPDHTTLSRRARTWKPSARSNDCQPVASGPLHVLVDSTGLKVYGAGQWLEEKHGAKSRRGWRKLHLAVDADNGEIIAHSLTDQEAGDTSQLKPLLDQIDDEIGQFTADGAYDGYPTYDAVFHHSAGARVVIPPRSNALRQPNAQASCQRDDHIASMQADGRLKWQTSTGYGNRALIETAMGRYKGVIGPRLRARSFLAQQTEAAIGVAILNRMLACGRPKSVRCQAVTGATK
ncbi:MAG: IS5 family transposase [Hyphomicrobiaceae bacterium]|nr:IS5 family transposase [Hyphomicrobiaceae bacterium]